MKLKRRFPAVALFVIVLITITASPSYSQPPRPPSGGTAATDQFTREQRGLERSLLSAPAQPPKATEEAPVPTKEEGPKFLVKKIILKGCESVPCEEFSKIIQAYEGRELYVSQLNVLAKDIESEYLKRGFITAVFLPPQDIKDNTVTLQIVEARMGELIIQKPPFYRTYLMKRAWGIKPGEVIRYDKMSRSIQMMNKNPDREVRAALKAGTKPETTDVILTAKTVFPIHFTTGIDNDGSISSGKYRTSLGVRDNNFLGLDDTLVIGQMTGDRFGGRYVYHNLPVSGFGTSFLWGLNSSWSHPNKDYDQYDMWSYSQTANGSIHQDIYKKDEYLGEVFVGFDFRDKEVYANSGGPDSPVNAGLINKDRVRVISFGGTYIKRTSDSVMYVTPEYDQGVRIFGASPACNPYASNDASNVYAKFLFGITERSRLPLGIQSNFKLRTQFAEEKLTPQEEFSLGGIDSVRGYPPSDYSADTAVLASYELLLPAIAVPSKIRMPYSESTLKDWTTGVLFIDYGYGQKRGLRRARNMTGVGMGLRFNVYNMATLRCEWAWPVGDKPLSAGRAGAPRFHLSLDFQDRMPEQIDTIVKMNRRTDIKLQARRLLDAELARKDSEARKELDKLKAEAESFSRAGKKEDYAKTKARIGNINRYLTLQAEDYVKSKYTYKEELAENKRLAAIYAEEGKDKESKSLMEKVLSAEPPKPPAFSLPKETK